MNIIQEVSYFNLSLPLESNTVIFRMFAFTETLTFGNLFKNLKVNGINIEHSLVLGEVKSNV